MSLWLPSGRITGENACFSSTIRLSTKVRPDRRRRRGRAVATVQVPTIAPVLELQLVPAEVHLDLEPAVRLGQVLRAQPAVEPLGLEGSTCTQSWCG